MEKQKKLLLTGTAYASEVQPNIQARLKPTLLFMIAGYIFALMNGIAFFIEHMNKYAVKAHIFIDLFNIAFLLFCSLALVYGVRQLKKGAIRHATNIFLLTASVSTVLLIYVNGGMGESAVLLVPIMIVIVGFFTNIQVLQRTRWFFAASISALYLLGAAGVTPLDYSPQDPVPVFFRFDQLVYFLLIIEISYRIVRLFVDDYSSILQQLKEDQIKLEHIATHDKLTGLPNRHACEKHFQETFHTTEGSPENCLLLFIDIDNFKNINTRFGHHGGDEALLQIADLLRKTFRENNTVVIRIGGDEFIIMLRLSPDNIDHYLSEVIASLAYTLDIFGQEEYITCSMGVKQVTNHPSSFQEEYRKVDMAMNRAKNTGKNRYCYFNRQIDNIALKNLELNAALRNALSKQEFALHYQSQIDLDSGRIIGAEALIRWHQPDGNIMLPSEFIPIAEQHGYIHDITYWSLHQACQDCAEWHAKGYPLYVSVNISPVVLENDSLLPIIRKACADAGLDYHFLELELTESILLENSARINVILSELRDMRINLVIDDFGTGYSNLSYLSRMNIQKLKIDQSFIKHGSPSSSVVSS